MQFFAAASVYHIGDIVRAPRARNRPISALSANKEKR
jgi:hypothetical protein